MLAVLNGRDALVSLPTGFGKSLIYQVPAMIFEQPTIVISPLIALMTDQERALEKRGVPVIALHSRLRVAERRTALERLRRVAGLSFSRRPRHSSRPRPLLCSNARGRRFNGGHLVVTERGTVAANSVFVATNGYSADAAPFLQPRVIGAASLHHRNESLPATLTRKLSPHGRMFSDTKRSLSYFRLSPDENRVIFGGRANARALGEERAAAGLFRQMCEIWPELAAFRISHCWCGNFGMTYDHIPHMGVHDGVHYAVGCNGRALGSSVWVEPSP